MKSSFHFTHSGVDYKAEFKGFCRINGKDCKSFSFFKEVGNSWQHEECKSFKVRATKAEIICEFIFVN